MGGLLILILFLFASRFRAIKPPPAFNSVDSTAALDLMNYRPIPKNAVRVLFVGDSLTIHGLIPQLWDHFSGMAATSPSEDFVHRTTAYVQSRMGARPVEIFYDNGGNGRLGPMLNYISTHSDLAPDLLILQGGENDTLDLSFKDHYASLLGTTKRTVVLGDWFDDEKSSYEQSAAVRRNFPFVDLRSIQKNTANWGDGGPYHVAGVARHPNDGGMKAISDAISIAIQPYIEQLRAEQPKPQR